MGMDGYRRTGHAVYLVTYHIVFVTKYRKPCINRDVGEYLKKDLTAMIEGNKGHVHAAEYEKDHFHLLAELPIDQPVAKFIGVLKGVSSRNVRREFAPYLSQFLWKDSFWSDSYFVSTTGGASIDVVKEYVNSQRTERSNRGRPPKKK